MRQWGHQVREFKRHFRFRGFGTVYQLWYKSTWSGHSRTDEPCAGLRMQQYCAILRDIARYCAILRDNARYCAILGDIRRSFAIHRKFPLEQGLGTLARAHSRPCVSSPREPMATKRGRRIHPLHARETVGTNRGREFTIPFCCGA